MGMPTVPAYVNVALLLGPLLAQLGVSFFTANMFVFYFAVASAITPPVAVAAFAAASITRTEPMRTALSAVRVGIVMFTIPFVFAWYPELLLIPEAVTITDETGRRVFMDGYSENTDFGALMLLLCRLLAALYLIASALARFDRAALKLWEVGLRILAAILILWKAPVVIGIGVALSVLLVSVHIFSTSQADKKRGTTVS
jgi:TRAP-type uncharacterized transport system fused permease subunit